MVLKFLGNKNGGGVGSVDYALSPDRVADGTAIILKGDERITRELIAGIDNKHKTTFAVLSFEEADIPEAEKFKLMRAFEQTFFAGLRPDQYNTLWVQHTDKGRLELNMIAPKIELTTGKAYNPYNHKTDFHLADMFQNWANIEHGYSDPKDPAKESRVSGKRGKFTAYNGYRQLDKMLQEMVAAGTIQDRTDLIESLKENNIKVIAVTADHLEIQLPEGKNGKQSKPRKLQGSGIYTDRFRSIDDLEDISGDKAQRARAFAGRRDRGEGREIGRRLTESVRKRSEFNQARFRPKEPKARNDSRRDETRQPEVARGIEASPEQSPGIARTDAERARELKIVPTENNRSSQQRPQETQEARKPIPMGSNQRDMGEIEHDRIRSAAARYAQSRARRNGSRKTRTARISESNIRINATDSGSGQIVGHCRRIIERAESIIKRTKSTDYRAIGEAVRGRQLRSYIAESVKQLPRILDRVTHAVVERVKELTKPIDRELEQIRAMFGKDPHGRTLKDAVKQLQERQQSLFPRR